MANSLELEVADFEMFYAHDKKSLRECMEKIGLEEVRFKFDFEGTKVVLS